jgi:hypothetical protein
MRVDAARRLQHRRFRRDPQLLQLRKRRIIPTRQADFAEVVAQRELLRMKVPASMSSWLPLSTGDTSPAWDTGTTPRANCASRHLAPEQPPRRIRWQPRRAGWSRSPRCSR